MSRVFAVKYIPEDDHIFVSAGWDDTVQVSVAVMMVEIPCPYANQFIYCSTLYSIQ